jgi:N-acetylglucosaminyl-diphospho-decaprenol L-rhamnosyltransferase
MLSNACPRSADMQPWVRVVIVNYNAGPLLAAAIEGLARQSDPDFEAVIVDNASTDGSAEACVLPDERFRFLDAGANLGFAAGCNLGCRGAETPWLAMLNPDAIPDENWLAALRQATLRYPEAVLFGSTQVDAADPTTLDGGGDNYSIFGLAWRGGHGRSVEVVKADMRVFSPCAAAALYRRDIFEAAGGFAESFFCYMEDVDLGFRLNLCGHEAMQVAAARVRHAGSATSGGRMSRFSLYHGLRNSVFVTVRCMPFPLVCLALPLMILSQVWIGARTGRFAVRMEGVRDGLRCLPQLLGQRRAIQARRRISIGELSRLLVWNPRTINRLAIVPLPRRPRTGTCGGGPVA